MMTQPIFIIGTGRCGTSLLVRILQSHQDIVVYPTEANELWHPHSYPYSKSTIQTPPILINPKHFTELSLQNWPENHRDFIRRQLTLFHVLKGSSKNFVVKSTMISFMLPKILSIFPGARFIHLYRNGISVVDSLVKKEWKKHVQLAENEESFRTHCAKYWKQCLTEIDQVNESLLLRKRNILYELSYEDLCSEPKEEIDGLADFIGCDSDNFLFDFLQIQSTNDKVGDYLTDKRWHSILEVLSPMMKQKRYPT